MDMLEDIIGLENPTQYDKDLTLNKARQETHLTGMNYGTQHNNGVEINNDCTVKPDKQIPA